VSLRRLLTSVTTTIYLGPGQIDRLRALSDRTRVPMAVYIRDGIDLILLREAGEKSQAAE